MSEVKEFIRIRKFCKIPINNYYKVWISSMDGDSCSVCAKLEGMAVPLNEYFIIKNEATIFEPPAHAHCRCTIAFDEVYQPQLRRDYETSKEYISLLNSSLDFNSFFSAYESACYFLKKLSDAGQSGLMAAGFSPQSYNTIKKKSELMKKDKEAMFNQAIKRLFIAEIQQSNNLKTSRGKLNRMEQFRKSTLETGKLSDTNKDELNRLIESWKNTLP